MSFSHVPAGMTPLAELSRACGVGANTLGQQINEGAWSRFRVLKVKTPRTTTMLVPEKIARKIIEFHKNHKIMLQVCQELDVHRNAVERAEKIVGALEQSHPLVKKIGGRLQSVKKGSFTYFPKEQVEVLKNFVQAFQTVEQMEAQLIRLGLPASRRLEGQLRRGEWPGVVWHEVNFMGNLARGGGKRKVKYRQVIVHKDLLDSARKFVEEHYDAEQAMERAGVNKHVISKWTVKWGFPVVRKGVERVFYPRKHFDELAAAFKQGKKFAQAALAALENYEDRQPKMKKRGYEARTPLEAFVKSKMEEKAGVFNLDYALQALREKQERSCSLRERVEAGVALQEARGEARLQETPVVKLGEKEGVVQSTPASELAPAPKVVYDPNKLRREFRLQGVHADRAEAVLNNLCTNRLQQLLVEHNLKNLLNLTAGSAARDAVHHYLQLLHDSKAHSEAKGKLHEQFARDVHALLELGLPRLELAGALGNLSAMNPAERRPEILKHFLASIDESSLAPNFSFQELMNQSFYSSAHEVKLDQKTVLGKVIERHPQMQPKDFKGIPDGDLLNFLYMNTGEVQGVLSRIREAQRAKRGP